MTLPTMITNVWQAFYGRRFLLLLRRFGRMAAAAVIGVIGVAALLGTLGSAGMLGWMGRLLVLYALDRALRLAPGHAARRRALGQSADRTGERRGGGRHRHGRRPLPALHAVAADHAARPHPGSRHHVPVHHDRAGRGHAGPPGHLHHRPTRSAASRRSRPPSPASGSARRCGTRPRPRPSARSSCTACWHSASTWRTHLF